MDTGNSRRQRRATLGLALAAVLLLPSTARPEEEPPPEPATPRAVFKGFGNVDFLAADGRATFSLGEIDLFLTSSLSEGVSVLAEVNVEQRGTEASTVEIERFQIQFAPSDRYRFILGRIHTSLGFWNQTFHHGTWIQTTAERPVIYRFEDDEGVLPVHEVGLMVAGDVGTGRSRLEYALSVTNGRAALPTDVQTIADQDGLNAVNLWLGFRPGFLHDLMVGGVIRRDRIPAAPELGRSDRLKEQIFGGYAAYRTVRSEILAEYLEVRHEQEATPGLRYDTRGAYLQVSHAFRHVRPYYRFDWQDGDPDDPFYRAEVPYIRSHTAGLRFDPHPWVALKVEGSAAERRPGGHDTSGFFQVAFTF